MKKFLLIILISCFGLALSATNYISVSNGNWNNPNTWSTNSVPNKTVTGSDIIIITNGFTVTMTEDLILEDNAQLKILNGGTLQMGDNGNPASTFTMKSSSNKFYINGGTYTSYSPGSGGNLLIENGLIDWRDGIMYVSGNYDFKPDVDDVIMINMCIRVAQNILFDGVGSSGSHAIMTNVSHISGLEGTGNLSIKGGSYIDATDIRLNASSNTSNLEFFDSSIFGSIYAINGKEKITISGLSGSPSLEYYCYGDLDGGLGSFSGSPQENCTIAQEICTEGGSTEETDLKIEKTANPSPVSPGETVSWTIEVTNIGSYAAENTSVSDVLPSEVSFVNAIPSKGSWSGSSWTIGDMAVNEVVTLTLVTNVNSGVSGNVNNTATVTTTTPETNEDNNTDSATVIVEEAGDIENDFDGTLAYEDLWPGKGDYDFNDLILDYNFKTTSNTGNYVVTVEATFTIKAFGAGFQNGFGFQLASTIDQADITVSGYSLTENYISLNGNGTEDGQSKPTIIVYDNAYNEMEHPGVGIGVNTDPSAPYVAPKTIEILITFPADTYTINDLDIANFNPFLIVNQTRGHEVCLPNYPPTDLMDESLFATYDDDSNPGSGKYFKTSSNLPWAINIIDGFDYPKEKKEISTAYLHFIEWAESGGTQFPDWYMDKSGYRNSINIY